jgi:hypothetical protein
LQAGENLVWIAEGEVIQHDHHLLLIARQILRGANDQRGRKKTLHLAQAEMRMHPVGAGNGQGKIVLKGCAGGDRILR